MDELYVVARQVLLDAIEGLGDVHRNAMVLVGAQAVYLRVGEADLAVAPYTTDGDLAIDPQVLAEIPPLERALRAAGFLPKTNISVGMWITKRATAQNPETEVQVDLLVPSSVSPGTGRRAARLPGHDTRVARIAKGLDGVLVDVDVMKVAAFDPSDGRSVELRVAGPAALLVAKAHKISDRRGSDRQSDKDALDVLRLLRGTETKELAARYRRLFANDRAAGEARAGRAMIEEQFGSRQGVGIDMAIRSAGPLADADEVAISCEALVHDLLGELDDSG